MSIYNVVLSGGVGSRLWPLSRLSEPKQYLPLFDGKSLFELALDRNRPLTDKVIVVGNERNRHLNEKKLTKENRTCIEITETVPRNTAAAILFAAFEADDEDILLVTPSDHLIEQDEKYAYCVGKAVELANKENALVLFGIHPTKPETGYGYIESSGYNVISFREKPDSKTAKSFLERGNFLWNSGMFCFKAGVLKEEMIKHQPELFEKAFTAWNNRENGMLDHALCMEIPSISIDYAVMEKSNHIKVIPADFVWNDLGSFESLYEYYRSKDYPVDTHGNMAIGNDRFTAFVGMKNTILVSTPTANLILQKENSQEVKDLYSALENDHPELI